MLAAGGCHRGGDDGSEGDKTAETKGVDAALFDRGAQQLENESWDEAAATFTEVLKGAPNDENTLFHRASAYLALARENYRAAAEAITNNKEALAAEKTAAADDAFEKATADCRAIIEKNPDCADAHYALGSIKIYQGQWDDALEEFSAVIRIDPNYAAAYQRRGEVAGFIGDTVSEAADLKKAAELGYKRSEIDEAGNVLSD
ncbi:MAG: tetratricopeptide repeat protein [Thermoguttaceae bacterium]|nr:tetratricopeptide repeat protein [Thermoguttaceae bacterium]MBR3219558.1 tetratricopeptide repeat protein [Thermoguttaceae bacterium]